MAQQQDPKAMTLGAKLRRMREQARRCLPSVIRGSHQITLDYKHPLTGAMVVLGKARPSAFELDSAIGGLSLFGAKEAA